MTDYSAAALLAVWVGLPRMGQQQLPTLNMMAKEKWKLNCRTAEEKQPLLLWVATRVSTDRRAYFTREAGCFPFILFHSAWIIKLDPLVSLSGSHALRPCFGVWSGALGFTTTRRKVSAPELSMWCPTCCVSAKDDNCLQCCSHSSPRILKRQGGWGHIFYWINFCWRELVSQDINSPTMSL